MDPGAFSHSIFPAAVQTGCTAAPESGADIIFIEKRRSYLRA
jgi:hypothetical protein